jgi:glycosyltransferase involved in cell wall biosynthesis
LAQVSRSDADPSRADPARPDASRAEAARAEVLPLRAESPIELSVVMPCLNEEETLATCIRKAQQALADANISGEVIIADNGSTDRSISIAQELGARVIHVTAKGYGSALRGGIAASRGKFILMGDADDSYDFTHLPRFVDQLRQGKDLVMGNRFRGGIQKGAMPALHRYLGNPTLTKVGRILFQSSAGDFHCGLRAFTRDAYERMGLRTTGMEFASEMVVKATLFKMHIAEVPTTLSPDGRSRPPHLRTWRDGWRHLRFLLMYSPRWLFLYPGLFMVVVGLIASAILLPGTRAFHGIGFGVHTLLYAFVSILLGFQLIAFATFTKVFAITEGLLPEDLRLNKVFRWITLETGLIVGALMILAGLAGSLWAVSHWAKDSFGALDPERTLRIVMPAVFALTIGVEIVFSSFFLSILGLRRR